METCQKVMVCDQIRGYHQVIRWCTDRLEVSTPTPDVAE